MPRATRVLDAVTRVDLKTCPEGYVELRTMSYGEYLRRQEMVMDMTFSGDGKGERQAEVNINQLTVTAFEFKCCVVGHNLTDENDQLLNFKESVGVQSLDSVIGQEISEHITKLITFDENEGNSEG